VGEPQSGGRITEHTVTFGLADPEHHLTGVRLVQDVRIPGDRLGFHRRDDGWELVIDRPPVHRMEYLLELRHQDGGVETVLDPSNPRQAAGAFGPKSVLEFPGYTPPGWLSVAAEPGNFTDFEVPVKALDAAVSVRVWSPPGIPDDERLPLLLAHDGPVAQPWLIHWRAPEELGPAGQQRWPAAPRLLSRCTAR